MITIEELIANSPEQNEKVTVSDLKNLLSTMGVKGLSKFKKNDYFNKLTEMGYNVPHKEKVAPKEEKVTPKEEKVAPKEDKKVSDVDQYVASYENDWRKNITRAERLMGQIFYAMHFLKNKNQTLGHLLEENIDFFGFEDISPIELNDAFERAISNYLILEQPEE